MTKDKARKRATRDRVGGTRDRRTDMSYTEAHRTDPHRVTADELGAGGGRGALPVGQIEKYLDEAERLFRSDDPYLRQSGYAQASRLYGELAEHADNATWAMAATMTGQMYAVLASQTRFEHRIPTLYPKTEAQNLHLGCCDHCGRPWQSSVDGACEHCPRLLFGTTPQDAGQARQLPAGDPVDLGKARLEIA